MEDALPGRPSPLGATPRDGGINFAVASSVAEAAEICLFDEAGHETRFRLPDYDGGAWHGFVPGIDLGTGTAQAYGFRVRGPYDRRPGRAGAAGAAIPRHAVHPAALVRRADAARRGRTRPHRRPGLAWRAEIDTFDPAVTQPAPILKAGDRVTVGPRSVLVLRGPRADG